MAGEAMAMKLQLARLASKHRVSVEPHRLQLTAPTAGPVVVHGLASTTHIDLARNRFKPWAFSNPALLLKSYNLPPLLYKHDPNQIAGQIQSLEYDARGNVRIVAEVSHELARRCPAFSVGATVKAYELRDEGSSNFHAVITEAEITEISLTESPANPFALVESRYSVPPHREFYDKARRGIEIIQEMLQTIAEQAAAAPFVSGRQETKHDRAPRPTARPPIEPHRATPFGRLIDAMEARSSPCE